MRPPVFLVNFLNQDLQDLRMYRIGAHVENLEMR